MQRNQRNHRKQENNKKIIKGCKHNKKHEKATK
jgi:hypothetical protein